MKPMNLSVVEEVKHGEELEKEGRLEEAAKLYESAIRSKTGDEQPYHRLMIIYRKLKRPKDELRVIKYAIGVFQAMYLKKSSSRKLTSLSKALLKSTGLANAKGKLVYYPEPINKWQKRMELLEKRMKK